MDKKKNKDNKVNSVSGEHLLPGGIKISDLKGYYDMSNDEYATVLKRLQLLDAADRGDLWKALNAKMPKYQVMPETNHVNYVKENLMGSVYAVGRHAELLPKAHAQIDKVNQINTVLETLWDDLNVSEYQIEAGERAALFNIGITQVGWDKTVIGGTTGFKHKGDVKLKNINPMKFMRDPYAAKFADSKFVMTWEDYHMTTLKSIDVYKERIKEITQTLGKDMVTADSDSVSSVNLDTRAKNNKSDNKYQTVQMYWVRYINEEEEEKIAEIHLLNNKYVLYVNDSLTEYPFAILYCNIPGEDLIGVSEPSKIFKNYVAYNMITSIVATHAYKAQRPPRFVNMASGINLRQFAKYGADADKTFPVNGDAREAVHYGKFPELPATIDIFTNRLEFDIKDKSGIDAVYAGRDTGSIQTTGGMDMLAMRATARDEIKVKNYEKYTKDLTNLIVKYYVQYGIERTYAVKDPVSGTLKDVKVLFKDIPDDINFAYSINIQNTLPRSKMRLAQAANVLLEKQAQYKNDPEIITMEEWLMMQDIPFKDLIMSRIKIQRNNNKAEEVTQILFEYAGLIEQGTDPMAALEMVTASMQQAQDPQAQLALGNQANAGSFQQMQAAPTSEQAPIV